MYHGGAGGGAGAMTSGVGGGTFGVGRPSPSYGSGASAMGVMGGVGGGGGAGPGYSSYGTSHLHHGGAAGGVGGTSGVGGEPPRSGRKRRSQGGHFPPSGDSGAYFNRVRGIVGVVERGACVAPIQPFSLTY